MKLLSVPLLLLFTSTTLAGVASPARRSSSSDFDTSSPTIPELMSAVELDKRRGCTGYREQGDVCKGKLLGAQNSFHNCKNSRNGWCCAKNKNGDYGLDVNKGIGREDCGYCFSGKCRAE